MAIHSARQVALGRLRSLAVEACGFSLEQIDDEALLHKVDAGVRRLGGLFRYVEAVAADATLRQAFVEALCTHETRFFRHAPHFKFLQDDFLTAVAADMASGKRPRRLRAWSVACSTGEEPVSIAISSCERLGEEVDVRVLGTDLSRHALERASELRWPVEFVQHLPEALLARYFLRGVGKEDGYVRPIVRVRNLITFEQLNLVAPPARALPTFDVIFCRNVLIYFGAETRVKVATWLLQHLAPDGILVTGPSEGISHDVRGTRMVAPHVYCRSEA